MKNGIRVCSFLAVFVVIAALVTAFCTVAFAASTEATLTVTPEGGTAQTFSGTYQELDTKVGGYLLAAPTVKTEYVIKLNANASMTKAGSWKGNENCFVTVDLNGYTLDVSSFNSNLWLVAGSVNFTLDGANDKGEPGKIINNGLAGGLIYTQNKAENAGVVMTVSDLEYVATNMAQGYAVVDNPSKSEYPNQPMCHMNIGVLNVKNVKMVFTGENSKAVEGSEGSPEGDITQMKMRFLQCNGGTVNFENCQFIDTNTKGIQTVAAEVGGSAKLTYKNCTLSAELGAVLNGTAPSMTLTNCKVSGKTAPFGGTGKITAIDTEVIASAGTVHNGTGSVTIGNSASGISSIVSSKVLSGNYNIASGYKLSEPDNGIYTVIPNGTAEATLSIAPVGGTMTFYSGTYQDMHTQLSASIKAQSVADASYTLTLLKDSSYTLCKEFAMNTSLAAGSVSRVTVDLNGYTLTAPGVTNNLYTIKGTTTSTLIMTIDGANSVGKRGKLICTGLAGALFFTRANDSLNVNTVATAKNLELVYTNMAQGYANESPYPNQPMMHLPAGKAVYLTNLKMTYTGEDASAVAGKDLANMQSSMIAANGVQALYIDGCEFTDLNTKGITTHGVGVSGATTKVVIKNSKISATYGIICSKADASVDIVGCDVSGTKVTYSGIGTIKVTDTESRVPNGSVFAQGTSDSLFFIYGEGKNAIYSASALTGDYELQTGYTLEAVNGVYTMKEDTSVEATLVVNPYGGKPTFTVGTYNKLHDSLSSVAPNVRTEYTVVLNNDAVYSAYKAFSVNSNTVIKIDLNGHTLNATVSANIYQFTGSPTLTIDGSDKTGNVGKLIASGLAGAIFYPRNNGTNDEAVMNLLNIEMTYTNMAQGYASEHQYPNQPMSNIPAGRVTYENVKVMYTGTDATAADGKDITQMYTAFISIGGNAKATIINSEFYDTNTKGIQVRGVSLGGNAEVDIVNCKFDTYAALVSAGSYLGEVSITDSEISSSAILFNGPASVTVKDSVLETANKFSTSNAKIYLLYGTGKNEIFIPNGTAPDGSYTVEEGYMLCAKKEGHLIVSDGNGFSTVTMPSIFGSGMVIQRNKPINIYGNCATDGAKIKVTLDGISKTVTASDGKWCAVFDAMAAKKGITLTIEQLDVEVPMKLEYTDIDIGEIWLISGQSNANYELYKLEDAHEYISNADNYDNIRIYAATSKYELEENPNGIGAWYDVTSELLSKNSVIKGQVSAIAYVMATRLAIELDSNVTVAIMDVNYNGSGVAAWISEQVYRESFPDGDVFIDRLDDYRAFYSEYGRYPSSGAELANYVSNIYANVATSTYNAMMASLNGFNIRGAVWMQGEGNASMGYGYKPYYEAVAKTFRNTFVDSKLPIFVIQLHPFSDGAQNDIRDAQYEMVDEDPYSYLITAARCGTVFNDSDFDNNSGDTSLVHQSRKSPIGHRLADAVLKEIYENPEYENKTAPAVEKVEIIGGKVVITFDTDVTTEVAGDKVDGFEIAGSDGEFVKADATVSGNKITVSVNAVTDPKEVRYGYGYFLVELNDGTLFSYYRKNIVEYTDEYLVVNDTDGTEYTFVRNDIRVVRTRFNGNITNSSGHPLPIFRLEVGYNKQGG